MTTRITARIAPFQSEDGTYRPIPLLTLEEFFDGNDAVGSILCNVALGETFDAPTPQQVRDILDTIRSRDDVEDVRVAIAIFDDPAWPFSEEVVVVTTASPDEVRGWFPEQLAPDEVLDVGGREFEDIAQPHDKFRVCWWD